MELNICHLYPDVLNLYGDRGNVMCLKRRLQWRGIECNIQGVGVDEKLDATKFDLFFMGSGQTFEQDVLLGDVLGPKGHEIRAAIEDEMPFLVVCGGFQLLGNYLKTTDGRQIDLLGAMDMYTVEKEDRLIGDYMFRCDELNGQTVVGFENHAGRTYLGDGVRPIGNVVYGNGNNGEDGVEGGRYKNVFGTFAHGCLLPKNPRVADLILKWALERKYPGSELPILDDTLELNAHQYMVNRLQTEHK